MSDAPESSAAKKPKPAQLTNTQPTAMPQQLPKPDTAAADSCITGQPDAAACQGAPCAPPFSSKVLSDAHRASPPPVADTLDWAPPDTLAAAHQTATPSSDHSEALDTAQAQPQPDSLLLQLEPELASSCKETQDSKAEGSFSLAQPSASMAHAGGNSHFVDVDKASCDRLTGAAETTERSVPQASICCLKDMLSLVDFDLTPVSAQLEGR